MHNFWELHGFIFIFFMFFFPRLTLLISNIATGGIFWWLGWFFAPRLLVAILATNSFWHTNTVMVVLTWFWALSGEASEKKVIEYNVRN